MLRLNSQKVRISGLIKVVYYSLKYWKELDVDLSCIIGRNSSFEGANKIYPNTYFCGSMGYGSYIGPNCEISANIGKFTSLAPHVKINVGIHPFTKPYATTCPMFYSTRKQNGLSLADRTLFDEEKPIPQIGNDCWIGENAFICGGINIGDGAVVLAGAVVTKDIPPYAIVGGIPAKVLDYRFSKDTIDFLLKYKWWNKDKEWLKMNWQSLCDIDTLMYDSENTNN